MSRRLDEADDKGYLAHEMLGQLQEDVRKFRQRCATYKVLPVAIMDDDHSVLGVGRQGV